MYSPKSRSLAATYSSPPRLNTWTPQKLLPPLSMNRPTAWSFSPWGAEEGATAAVTGDLGDAGSLSGSFPRGSNGGGGARRHTRRPIHRGRVIIAKAPWRGDERSEALAVAGGQAGELRRLGVLVRQPELGDVGGVEDP